MRSLLKYSLQEKELRARKGTAGEEGIEIVEEEVGEDFTKEILILEKGLMEVMEGNIKTGVEEDLEEMDLEIVGMTVEEDSVKEEIGKVDLIEVMIEVMIEDP